MCKRQCEKNLNSKKEWTLMIVPDGKTSAVQYFGGTFGQLYFQYHYWKRILESQISNKTNKGFYSYQNELRMKRAKIYPRDIKDLVDNWNLLIKNYIMITQHEGSRVFGSLNNPLLAMIGQVEPDSKVSVFAVAITKQELTKFVIDKVLFNK